MRSQRNENFEVPLGSYIFKRDESGAKLQLKDGKSFSITIPESRILYKLIQTPNDVVDKNTLILEAWGSAEIIGPNSLPVAITNLRKVLKLKNIQIINAPKKGYYIQIPDLDSKNVNFKVGVVSNNENKEIEPKITLDAPTQQINNDEETPLWSMYLSILLILFSFYIIFYTWLSWVEYECTSFEKGTVCYIKEDYPPDPLEFKGKTGNFFYSTSSGWIKVEGKHYD
ncbi:winged helix-turn-helix domain-containing protein [Vibrio chagasii]|uniref:winged helix-turn-helix domain-containing protein n=1 Tax=Vibrio chagasii TaxID=170679 RepID=UPI002284D780|nr:winged helix-turn-helix domain-containing protein [Vibrio chagasii]MCY9829268.1 winged helix-turn-helix domain-containing protein [Vibrio chagasii]